MLGEEAQLGRAIELAGLDERAADRAALELVRLEVLQPGIKVQFVHPVVRAAIYERSAAPERVRLHRRAIEIMKRVSAPPTLIASHLLRVDPAGDAEAVALLRAGRRPGGRGRRLRSASAADAAGAGGAAAEEQLTGVLAQLGAAEMLIDGPSAIEHLGAAFERDRRAAFKVALTELLARALVIQERIPRPSRVGERTLATIPERRAGAAAARSRRCSSRRAWSTRASSGRAARALRAAARRGGAEGEDYGSRAMLSLAVTARCADSRAERPRRR